MSKILFTKENESMKCINHPDRDAVANCKTCGKGLCQECASKITPIPQCIPCFRNDLNLEKTKSLNHLFYQQSLEL